MYAFLLPLKDKRHKRTRTGSPITSYPLSNKIKTQELLLRKNIYLKLFQAKFLQSLNEISFKCHAKY